MFKEDWALIKEALEPKMEAIRKALNEPDYAVVYRIANNKKGGFGLATLHFVNADPSFSAVDLCIKAQQINETQYFLAITFVAQGEIDTDVEFDGFETTITTTKTVRFEKILPSFFTTFQTVGLFIASIEQLNVEGLTKTISNTLKK